MSQMQVVSLGGSPSNPVAQSPSTGAGEDRFLKLLVAQLKNQDPLNPLDNAQVTSQMAQISTVSGVQQLNSTMQAMSGSFMGVQPLQAAGVVGRQVLVSGTSMRLSNGSASGGFVADQPVDKLTISIRDVSGAIVHQAEMGPQQSGMHTFEWDGIADNGQRAADGSYTFAVSAMAAGKKVEPKPLAISRVDGVNAGGGELTLSVRGLGAIRLADIKQIF